MIGIIVVLFWTTGVSAMMEGGSGPGMGGGHMGGGMGSGVAGAGGIMSGLMDNTVSFGYLDMLNPIETPDEARAAIQAFIDKSNSNLQISELWEYKTVYKAELEDSNGQRAFDLIADKFTGAVMPETGMSMMLNASYGKALYEMPASGKNLTVTPEQAIGYAKAFVDKNGFGYILGTPRIYPGYYKFHATSSGSFGMDIMINGYNGKIWMNTVFGLPIAQH